MSHMPSWIAVSFGALDVRGNAYVDDQYEIIVTPVVPGSPLFLFGEGADLWRRLADAPITEDALSDAELAVLDEMETSGIVSRDLDHPARIRQLQAPWLSSPVHELVYALLQRVAEANDVDIVFIKGPTLHAQGLRDREHSGDVDCWVRPGQEVRLAEAMSAWGWTPAYSAFTSTRVLHSLTLRAGAWGSAIDVHSWFPGMAISHQRAYELLEGNIDVREFAGTAARTPARQVHAIISALHDIRPVLGQPPDALQNERAGATLVRAGESVIETSNLFGTNFALAEPLRQAFPDKVGTTVSNAQVPEDWAWRSQSSPRRAYIEAFKLIPLRERPRVLWRVIWPTAQRLRSGPLGEGQLAESSWRLRMRRLRHGFRLLTQTRRG
jgi:hypothetical protein